MASFLVQDLGRPEDSAPAPFCPPGGTVFHRGWPPGPALAGGPFWILRGAFFGLARRPAGLTWNRFPWGAV